MSPLAFDVKEFDFAALAHYGGNHPLARIAGAPDMLGFPILASPDTDHVSSGTAGARCVITGQQPGLLTGPLYTFLKAVTAISLARRLSEQSGAEVRPLFWNACEDHDVLEVNRVTVNGRRFVHEYDGEIAHGRVPQVADISLADAREPLLDFLREVLPETEFTPWVLNIVGSADFSNYGSAFADIMRSLFAGYGLEIVSPIDLRPETGPVLARLVEKWADVQAAFAKGTEEVRGLGFEPPLESVGLFRIADGCRVQVDVGVHGGALAEEIRERPGDFSAGAALRPVLQDAVLHVVATIGGPSEVVYLRQIRRIYEAVGVTPSLIAPRISATFIESKIQAVAGKAGLTRENIFDAGRMLQEYTPREDGFPEADEVVKKERELMEALERAAGGKPSKPVERAGRAISSQVDRIVKRLREERLEAEGSGRRRLERVANALIQGGKPQERFANVMQFLNLYGPDLVRLAVETLDPFSPRHQAVFISTSSAP